MTSLNAIGLEGCPICRGEGWVCEDHQERGWDSGEGCPCGGAGAPCRCNRLHQKNLLGEE